MKLLFLVLLFPSVSAEAFTNAFAFNEPVSIESIDKFSYYQNTTDFKSEDDFILCPNQEFFSLFVTTEIYDKNGYEDILITGNISVILENVSSNQSTSLVVGQNLTATFLTRFLTLADPFKNGTKTYNLTVNVTDNDTVATNTSTIKIVPSNCVFINVTTDFINNVPVQIGNITVHAGTVADGTVYATTFFEKPSSASALPRYVDVWASQVVVNTLDNITITFNYTDKELGSINENALKPHYLSNGIWNAVSAYTHDPEANSLIFNTTRLTQFALFEEITPGGSGSSSSCHSFWDCSEWSVCSDGVQTRSCYDTNCDEEPTDDLIKRACYDSSNPEPVEEPEEPKIVVPTPETPVEIPQLVEPFRITIDLDSSRRNQLISRVSIQKSPLVDLSRVTMRNSIIAENGSVKELFSEDIVVRRRGTYNGRYNINYLSDGTHMFKVELLVNGELVAENSQEFRINRRGRVITLASGWFGVFLIALIAIYIGRKAYHRRVFYEDEKDYCLITERDQYLKDNI